MALSGNIWVLDGNQLLEARKRGIIQRLPDITKAELGDRSSGDVVTKALALSQALWFMVQLVLPWIQQLPISQIEISTAVIVVCSTISYAMAWDKPQKVMTFTKIQASYLPGADDVREIGSRGGNHQWFRRNALTIGADMVHNKGVRLGFCGGLHRMIPIHAISVSIALVLAAVHFLAWNFAFPSPQEQLGWRTACLILVAMPIPVSLILLHTQFLAKRILERKRYAALESKVVFLVETIYVLARSFILVEVVRTLLFLPAGAYIAPTIRSFSHIN